MRLTSSFWVAAYVRRCHGAGAYAVVRRRGSPEAGSVFVVVDDLAGSRTVFVPAPQPTQNAEGERLFQALEGLDAQQLEEKLAREISFDTDLWIVEVEDREGRHFLPLATSP